MSGTTEPVTALDAIGDLLGLRPAGASDPTGAVARFGVVAGRSGPRFLVPLDHPEAVAPSCLTYLGLRDLRTRVTRGAVGLALRAGGRRWVVDREVVADAGDGSLLAELATILGAEGGRDLAVAIGLPRVDEVWKPTLQVFHPDGEPAAFVKVGRGPVGAALVRREATALAAWAADPDPRLVVPDLLADTTWHDLPLAVVAPLPADARRLPPGRISARAVRLLGPSTTARVADAGWWTRRRAAAEGTGPLASLLERIEARAGTGERTWARWHGDWVPWNLARCRRGLIAWDWEYSEPDAPVGLDEVHGAYQQAHVAGGASVLYALSAARADAERIGAGPADAAWLADAHLAMLLTRDHELEGLLGHPTGAHRELLAAAHATLGGP